VLCFRVGVGLVPVREGTLPLQLGWTGGLGVASPITSPSFARGTREGKQVMHAGNRSPSLQLGASIYRL